MRRVNHTIYIISLDGAVQYFFLETALSCYLIERVRYLMSSIWYSCSVPRREYFRRTRSDADCGVRQGVRHDSTKNKLYGIYDILRHNYYKGGEKNIRRWWFIVLTADTSYACDTFTGCLQLPEKDNVASHIYSLSPRRCTSNLDSNNCVI